MNPPQSKKRLERLSKAGRELGIEGVIFLPGPNMRYFLDYSLETYERPSLCIYDFSSDISVLVPKLDENRIKVNMSADLVNFHSYSDHQDPWLKLKEIISAKDLEEKTFGIEGRTPYQISNALTTLARLRLIETDRLFFEIRMLKDQTEIQNHLRAAEITKKAMVETAHSMKPLMTERDAVLLFQKYAYDFGGEAAYSVVSAGINTANPHYEPTSKKIREEDIIIFDAGVTYEGYFSDVTRTICIGQPDDERKRIHQIVYEAQTKGIEAATFEAIPESIDSAARGVITTKGYGEFFTHRTGHGLGLEIHEEPFIREGSCKPIQNGMIFTIEPGIYIPGKFGARIEDDFIVVDSRVKSSISLSKDLLIKNFE